MVNSLKEDRFDGPEIYQGSIIVKDTQKEWWLMGWKNVQNKYQEAKMGSTLPKLSIRGNVLAGGESVSLSPWLW